MRSTGVVTIFLMGIVQGLELKNGAYEDLVVKIADNVPQGDCRKILDNLEATLTTASQYLFSALNGRAYLRSTTVLLPPSWPETCAPSPVLSGSGESSDITVLSRGRTFTQQSLGCGQPGDQIFFSHENLLKRDNTFARSLIKQFAMYRYGVFEEQGYYNDSIYPMCFYDDEKKQAKVTGCSDLPIVDNGICSDPNAEYNVTKMVDGKARSSIMFAAEPPSVSMFCDDGNHDKFAPTKHNFMCQGRSVFNVIIDHPDFSRSDGDSNDNNQITDTTPRIIYKKQALTRYVFVIENTKDMMQRDSWSYLRLAMRLWATYIIPDNTEMGLVLADNPNPTRVLDIVPAKASSAGRMTTNRDNFYSSVPYTTNESTRPGCLHCALREAKEMLLERTKAMGAASNVIVVIAPGMTVDDDLRKEVKELKKAKIKVASVNYPDIVRASTLRMLADETGGVDYAVFEQKLNAERTLLSTYFELHNVLYNIMQRFYSGNQADLPIEIHRKELTDDGRSSVTGSFMLDPNMGEPATFTFYTYDTDPPLFKGLQLISPSHQVSRNRNDKFIDLKMIMLNANISETGTWTYTVEPYPGNPQPHFLQVMATPKSPNAPVVRAQFRTHRNSPGDPLVLIAEVKYGDLPILGAKVEVTVSKPEANSSTVHKSKLELLDTGSGDPDVTKGDGIYSKYFSAEEWGPGLYTFEVSVTDNGNTAFTWSGSSRKFGDKPCCGSSVLSSGYEPISPFQRVLPKVILSITSDEILTASQTPVGRIGDLKVEVVPEDMKARLTWTSPDMGGRSVTRYEIRYGKNIGDVVDSFEISSVLWDSGLPFPLASGSETTFNLDFSQNKELLDRPLYFAVKSYTNMGSGFSSTTSNWVRVLVPSPPPPPTVAPTYSSNDQSGFWPNNGPVGVDPVSPSLAKGLPVGLELILPVVIGIILLVVLLVVYCYFGVVKKRARNDHKSSKENALKKDDLSATITIVPSSPQNTNQNPVVQPYNEPIPDPHQVGVPISNYAYEDETKKRYSLVNQQEQQLIEELKQQQQQLQRDLPPNYGLSVISTNTITRNGHPLSPYNSWSASQLLHEHERRHSPLEGVGQEEMLMNGSQMDHLSMGQPGEHLGEMYPPPVPPLPAFGGGYQANYGIYGVHQVPGQQQGHQIYQSMPRNEPFPQSLQGSMSSVNSGEKKRRNITMV